MSFEAINVEANPAALKDLEAFKAKPPAVLMGDRAFHGWNPKQLAAFVGVEYAEPEHLSWAKLLERLDRILAAGQRAIRQVPKERLDKPTPGRNRTVRSLGYHIFRLGLAFLDGMEQRRLLAEWLSEEAPPELKDGEAVARYGQKVREDLKKWFGTDAPEGNVMTYYGSQTTYELLERITWHTAQHLRQLYSLLEQMGETPVNPLTESDFKGLPLPKEIWG